MVAFDRNPQDFKYLRLLSRQFPTEQSAFTEIINLSAILNLPKGTEHFMSDVHGEYEAFMHILNNCSGVVREHVDEIFGDTLSFDEKGELCTLIYYPREKIDLVRSQHEDSPTWYKTMLDQLIMVARSLSSRYTRSKVRKAIPRDYAYIIDELLHTHPDENNYRVRYHERIVGSILETASADDFIESLASLIKRLAVDHLHLVGDIFDRGGGAAKIMDRLLTYHSLDIQWGNHDLLWMGAAAGEPACIATVLRNNLRYDNYEILENDYGISLRELVAFADVTYTAGESITPLIKAINVLLFKLEGQIIQRHPEFDMTDRLLLDKIDHKTGTVTLADGSVWPLTTNDFPTVDPADPYTLTPEEQHIIDKLVSEFVTADHLHRHIDFLYTHGSMYKVTNGNLLFHGCVPLNEDGTFSSMNCLGTWHAGRDYFDFCDHIARRAWRVGDRDALDWMWYLWIGFNSPASGRLVRTFERAYYRRQKHLGRADGSVLHAHHVALGLRRHHARVWRRSHGLLADRSHHQRPHPRQDHQGRTTHPRRRKTAGHRWRLLPRLPSQDGHRRLHAYLQLARLPPQVAPGLYDGCRGAHPQRGHCERDQPL